MERSNFPHRNLGEDDEELLNGIWAGLEMPDDRPDADGRDFDDVKRRIRRRGSGGSSARGAARAGRLRAVAADGCDGGAAPGGDDGRRRNAAGAGECGPSRTAFRGRSGPAHRDRRAASPGLRAQTESRSAQRTSVPPGAGRRLGGVAQRRIEARISGDLRKRLRTPRADRGRSLFRDQAGHVLSVLRGAGRRRVHPRAGDEFQCQRLCRERPARDDARNGQDRLRRVGRCGRGGAGA